MACAIRVEILDTHDAVDVVPAAPVAVVSVEVEVESLVAESDLVETLATWGCGPVWASMATCAIRFVRLRPIVCAGSCEVVASLESFGESGVVCVSGLTGPLVIPPERAFEICAAAWTIIAERAVPDVMGVNLAFVVAEEVVLPAVVFAFGAGVVSTVTFVGSVDWISVVELVAEVCWAAVVAEVVAVVSVASAELEESPPCCCKTSWKLASESDLGGVLLTWLELGVVTAMGREDVLIVCHD